MPQGITKIDGHPGLYRRPGCKTVYFRIGKGKRRQWKTAGSIPAAEKKRRNLQTDIDRELASPDGRMLLPDYGRRIMKSYTGRTRKGLLKETRDDYLVNLERYAFVFFAETKIGDISPLLVREFYTWLAERGVACRSCRDKDGKRQRCKKCGGAGRSGSLSPNTIRLAAQPLKIVLAVAYEEGVTTRNAADKVRVATPEQTEEELLEEDDEEDEGPVKALDELQLIAVLELIRARYAYWLLFVELLVELGLRIGEALELRWKDVDFEPEGYDGATIWIRRRWYRGRVGRPKSRFGRRKLKLAPVKAEKLWQHYQAELAAGRGGRNDLVLTTPVEHVRVDQGNLARDMLHPVREELGLPWLTWHVFRHTAITRRFFSGWNAKQVQIFAGHHDPAFTVSRYVHLFSEELPDPEPLTELVRLEVAA
jgi:integrase